MALRSIPVVWLLLSGVLLSCGCASPDPQPAATGARSQPVAAAQPASKTTDEDADRPRIILLGDSLTAGLGLDLDRSFPALVQERLRAEGFDYTVVNAGVSGDTSAGGLRRLEWALGEGTPRVLIVALGGNDGLRGLPPSELEKNLATIIDEGKGRGLAVILAGMEAPPNYGPEYTREFRETYRTLARRFDVPLIPFLLQGVAGDPSLNQPDGIHPNERGARIVAENVWRVLQPVLEKNRLS